jgi:cob(I)alamin adenosyltransferase
MKGSEMPVHFFRRFFQDQKTLFLQEAQLTSGFMRLLMKQRNTGAKWTTEEIAELKTYIRHLKSYMPLLTCFLLPGGFLLLPLLAARLERRKSRRTPEKSEVAKMGS